MLDQNVKLKRKAKGQRPTYFENPEVDKLLAMLMGLVGEVSVMRDRLDTVERLAEERGLFNQVDIESYSPSQPVLAERAKNREIMLSEITRIISSEIEGLRSDGDNDYENAVRLVEDNASA